MTARFLHARIVFLLAALAVMAAGCDSNEDKDDSDFAVIEGVTWTVTAFSIDEINLMGRLEDEYEEGVSVVFSEDRDTGERQFDFLARASESEGSRRMGGTLQIDSGRGLLFLNPRTGDVSRLFELGYRIDNNTQVTLVATNDQSGSGDVLRDFLLPEVTIGSRYPQVRLTIEHSAF